MDEPWIMTVKGPHSIKPPPVEESNAVNKNVHNGSGPPQSKFVHKVSNHYRTDIKIPVSIKLFFNNYFFLHVYFGFLLLIEVLCLFR